MLPTPDLEQFQVSYFYWKLFKIPVIKTLLEFTDIWLELNFHEKIRFVDYNLKVEEDDTEVFINFNLKPDSDVLTCCCIFNKSDKTKRT